MIELTKGKKTYATAAVMLALAIAQYAGITVPEHAWIGLNALGLGFLRQAVGK